MKFEFPYYHKGNFTGRDPVIIDLDEYHSKIVSETINDCLKKFYDYYNIDEMANTLRKLTAFDLLIEEINEKVGNRKFPKILREELDSFKKNFVNGILNDMSDCAAIKYKSKVEEMKNLHRDIVIKELTFLYKNKDAIIEALIEDKNKVIEFIKNKRCEDNKRYYDNKKKKLGIVARTKKTPEEVMEAKRAAAKKFYYKNKELEKMNKCSENEEQI